MKSNTIFKKGVYTALVTPFDSASEQILYPVFEQLLKEQAQAGIAGVVVCGSTGEAATLEEQEQKELLSFAASKLPKTCLLLAGVGSNDTKKAQRQAQLAEAAGAQALMIVTPAYNKPTQQGIIEHFKAIKQVTSLPLMAYNVPGRSAVNILPATVLELFKQGLATSIKEASGSLDQIMDLIAITPPEMMVFSGDDALGIPMAAVGGAGVVSVLSNVCPAETVRMYEYAFNKDFESAQALHYKLLPLMRALFAESNPIPVKAAMQLRGQIPESSLRLPLTKASAATIEKIQNALAVADL